MCSRLVTRQVEIPQTNTKIKVVGCKINNIELGLCCINNTLRNNKPNSIFSNRTCRLKTAHEKGLKYVQSLVILNLQDVLKMITWNYLKGIKTFRLSSFIFPHISNHRFTCHESVEGGLRYKLDFAKDLLMKIGSKAKRYGQRLSAHPGHFNQIGTKSETVLKNTFLDLKYHNDVFDIIETNLDIKQNRAILCIHGGGIYDDKQKTIERFCNNFNKLDNKIKSRICIENCEKCYNSEDCLYISSKLNIPHIFDIHHYHCYDLLHKDFKQKSIQELLPSIIKTWSKRNLKPYFHISNQGSGKIGHHSDYVQEIPQYMLDLDITVSLDIEAKAKEDSLIYLRDKYSKLGKT